MTRTTPRGWKPGLIEHRFFDAARGVPSSYDKKARTVDCVISMGSPVQRFYGTEVLEISPQAVIVDRLIGGGIPLLDSHNQTGINNALGRVTRVWFDRGALMGKLQFNDTKEGRNAEGMVARGEIGGISAGYRVEEWRIEDAKGNEVDPEYARWDDDALTFTATRWELLEASLVSVNADSHASVRSLTDDHNRPDEDAIENILARMRMRQKAHNLAQAFLMEDAETDD